MRTAIVVALLLAAVLPARADDLVFENDLVTYVLGGDGVSKHLRHKATGRELLAPEPSRFAWIKKGSKTYPATAIARRGEHLRVTFADSGVAADYAVDVHPRYIVFRLAAVHGGG